MSRARIWIPTEAEKSSFAIDTIKRVFAHLYGGYTTYSGGGGWVDDDGDLIEDDVVIIETYGDISEVRLEEYAIYVRNTTNEDSIMYAIDGCADYVRDNKVGEADV